MSENGNELDGFKRRVNLVQYAAASGFKIDRAKSWNGTTAMRNGDSLIFIKRKPNGHQVYWSPEGSKDSGTIIDFVQRLKGLNLGEVRVELRRLDLKYADAPVFEVLREPMEVLI